MFFTLRQILSQTEKKPYRCGICSKSFQNKTDPRKHENSHIGVKKCSCDVCHNKFSTNGNLNQHIQPHTCLKPDVCEICTKYFVEKGQLQIHIKAVHCVIKDQKCYLCDQEFGPKYALAKQLRVHTAEKPFNSSKCFTTFFSA